MDRAAAACAPHAALTLGSVAQGGLLAQQSMPAPRDVHRRRMISTRVDGVGVPVCKAEAPQRWGQVIAGMVTVRGHPCCPGCGDRKAFSAGVLRCLGEARDGQDLRTACGHVTTLRCAGCRDRLAGQHVRLEAARVEDDIPDRSPVALAGCRSMVGSHGGLCWVETSHREVPDRSGSVARPATGGGRRLLGLRVAEVGRRTRPPRVAEDSTDDHPRERHPVDEVVGGEHGRCRRSRG
jgi:hypothetical protein